MAENTGNNSNNTPNPPSNANSGSLSGSGQNTESSPKEVKTPSIKEVEKQQSSSKKAPEKKSSPKKQDNGTAKILAEISDKLKSLDTGVQNIAKAIVGEGKDKGNEKSSPKTQQSNPFDGLEKAMGGAAFRTAAKDIFALSLNQWIENSDFTDKLKESLNLRSGNSYSR